MHKCNLKKTPFLLIISTNWKAGYKSYYSINKHIFLDYINHVIASPLSRGTKCLWLEPCNLTSLEKTLMLGGIGDRRRRGDRGWDGWMASLTRWTWVRVNSGNWWWTGRPGMLRFMGLQRVGHDWATELNWTEYHLNLIDIYQYLICIDQQKKSLVVG